MKRLVCGVGLYEKGKYLASFENKLTKEYSLWSCMLSRCYNPSQLLRHPTYQGCSVSAEFSNFQEFSKWCNEQPYFGCKGYHLDKDVLYKGNKQYNRDSCCFIPLALNSLLTSSNSRRGTLPIGVYFKNGRYEARFSSVGKLSYIGRYNTSEEAFYAYKEAKEAHIKVVAEKYKDSIDPRVYKALMEWEVHTDD